MAKSKDLTTQVFKPTRVGLEIKGKPEIEEWLKYGERLRFIETSIQWIIGDYLRFGEFAYGEKYSQALDESQVNSWKVYQWVASRVPPEVRNPDLPWSYYRDIAKYDPLIQGKIINHVIDSAANGRELSQWMRSIDDRVFEFTADGELSEKEYNRICNEIVDDAIAEGIDVMISSSEFDGYYVPRTKMNCPHCKHELDVRGMFKEYTKDRRRGRNTKS
jgi:hypothetical protein